MGHRGVRNYLIMFTLVAILVSYGVSSQSFAQVLHDEDETSALNGSVQVTLLGCDGTITPQECTYRFTNNHSQAVSHINIGLSSCSDWIDEVTTQHTSIGRDQSIKPPLEGIKFEDGIESGASADYTIFYNVPEEITLIHGPFHFDTIEIGVKSGQQDEIVSIHGPLCSDDNSPPSLTMESVTAKTAFLEFDLSEPPVVFKMAGDDFTTNGDTDVSSGNRLFTVDAESANSTPVSWTLDVDDGLDGSGVASASCTNTGGALNPPDASIIGLQQTAQVNAVEIPYGNGVPHTTEITCTAIDHFGNSAQLTILLTVEDQQPPIIRAPIDVTIDATGLETTLSQNDLGEPIIADIADPSPTFTTDPVLPYGFPLDLTKVFYTATDAAGHSAIDSQDVILEDNDPPTITVPVIDPIDAIGVYNPVDIREEDVIATDNIGVASLVNDAAERFGFCDSDLPCFEAGNNTVTWTATDYAGNTVEAPQYIIVKPTPVEAGWLDSSVVPPEFPNHVITDIGHSQRLYVTDYRGNEDPLGIDLIQATFHSDTTPPGIITTTLVETNLNTGVFTHPIAIPFSSVEWVDELFVPLDIEPWLVDYWENDVVQVTDENDVVTATRTSDESITSAITGEAVLTRSDISLKNIPILGDTATATSDINDPLRSGGVLEDELVAFDESIYKINTSGNGVCFDPERFAGFDVETGIQGTFRMYQEEGSSTFFAGWERDTNDGQCIGHKPFTLITGGTTNHITKDFNVILDANGEATIHVEYRIGGVVQDTASAAVVEEFIGDPDLLDSGFDKLSLLPVINDPDGDGLDTSWEIAGVGLVVPNGGSVFTIPCINGVTYEQDPTGRDVCPNPLEKDLYIWIEHMQSLDSESRAIEEFVEAFNRAPLPNPGGPLGQDPNTDPGIRLHVLAQEPRYPFEPTITWERYHELKDTFVFEGLNQEQREARHQVMRDMLFACQQANNLGSIGVAEKPGNDSMITICDFSGGGWLLQAKSMIHETGHMLDLDDIYCNPVAFSEMDYCDSISTSTDVLGFERADRGTLDTGNLYETNTFSSQFLPLWTEWPTHWWGPELPPVRLSVVTYYEGEEVVNESWRDMDWNGNGEFDTEQLFFDPGFAPEIGSPGIGFGGIYQGHADWYDVDLLAVYSSTSRASGAFLDFEDAGRAELALLIAQELNPLRQQILALPEGPCQTELLLLEQLARDEFLNTDNTQEEMIAASIQIIEQIIAEIESSDCLEVDTSGVKGAAGGGKKQLQSQSLTSGEFEVVADIDIKSNGAITAILYGSAVFDVTEINAATVRISGENDICPTCGAEITHEFSSNNFKTQHHKFINDDEWLDHFLHFRGDQTGLSATSEGGYQRVCTSGEFLDGTTWDGCDDKVHVFEGTGKKGGPKK